jgi:hypothetical protein
MTSFLQSEPALTSLHRRPFLFIIHHPSTPATHRSIDRSEPWPEPKIDRRSFPALQGKAREADRDHKTLRPLSLETSQESSTTTAACVVLDRICTHPNTLLLLLLLLLLLPLPLPLNALRFRFFADLARHTNSDRIIGTPHKPQKHRQR